MVCRQLQGEVLTLHCALLLLFADVASRSDCGQIVVCRESSGSTCCLQRLPCDSCSFRVAPCPTVGLKWTMKLWDSLTTCLIVLSAVHASSLPRSRQPSTKGRERAADGPLESPPVQIRLSVTSTDREDTMTGGGKRKSVLYGGA